MHGLILRNIRESRHLPLSHVANKCGISSSQLHRLETGTRQLYLRDYLKICEALGEKPGDLLPNSAGDHARYTPIWMELRGWDPDVVSQVPMLLRAVKAVLEVVALKARVMNELSSRPELL